jgi:hypothetical protein
VKADLVAVLLAASRAKEHFVAEASRICDQAAQQGKAEDPSLAVSLSAADTKAAWDRVASTDQAAIAALRSVAPPPGDRVVVARMLAQFDRALGDGLVVVAVGQVADSFSRPFTAALTVAAKQAALAARAARDYGVEPCAELIYP